MQLESYPIRTDLALESQERLQKDNGQVKGVRLEEEKKDNGVVISTVFIDTENAAKAMGRPRGTYVTIEAPEMIEEDAGYHRDISVELAQILRQMVAQYESKVSDDLKEGMDVSVLIAGLGNREVTPDALGPKVVDNLFITRHIMNEFGKYAFSDGGTFQCQKQYSSAVFQHIVCLIYIGYHTQRSDIFYTAPVDPLNDVQRSVIILICNQHFELVQFYLIFRLIQCTHLYNFLCTYCKQL